MTIYSIGHSTHDPKTFKNLLTEAGIRGIIDVRSHPTSRWLWWHQDPARRWLERGGFRYEWHPDLGGWNDSHALLRKWAEPRGVALSNYIGGYFPKQRIGADADQQYERRPEWESKWTSQGLHDYAWFTSLEEFQVGIDEIAAAFGREGQTNMALVCAEAMWWKCHRSMIADVLFARGVVVRHVMPSGKRIRITEHDAEPRLDRYPSEVLETWRKYQ